MDRKIYKIIRMAEGVNFGSKKSTPIDQTPARSFNVDPSTGRPMEEITRVMRAQTLADQQNAFMNLPVFSSEFLPDDVSARDALKFMKPSLCQLPSELAEWSEKVAQLQYDKQVSELTKKEFEEKQKEQEKKAVESAAAAAAAADGSAAAQTK